MTGTEGELYLWQMASVNAKQALFFLNGPASVDFELLASKLQIDEASAQEKLELQSAIKTAINMTIMAGQFPDLQGAGKLLELVGADFSQEAAGLVKEINLLLSRQIPWSFFCREYQTACKKSPLRDEPAPDVVLEEVAKQVLMVFHFSEAELEEMNISQTIALRFFLAFLQMHRINYIESSDQLLQLAIESGQTGQE